MICEEAIPLSRSRRGPLLDHFVGAQQNRLRHGEPERLGGLGVNSHLKFDRHLNRQVGRLCATENAIHIGRGAPKQVRAVGSVGKQTAVSDKER